MLATNSQYMEDFDEPNKYQGSLTGAVVTYSVLTVFSIVMIFVHSGKCNAIKDRFKSVHKNLEEKEQKENLPSSVNESLLQNQE